MVSLEGIFCFIDDLCKEIGLFFNLPSSEPTTALFRRVNQEVILEDVYTERSEEEAILLPQAMTSFPNMPPG